jgi:formylglycine-generating enzyme required for sulfatase activity
MATNDARAGSARIFISYRREDAEYPVGRLAEDLRQHFARDQVFQDIASIDPGADFVEALQRALDTCAAVLVVIGPKWLTVADRQGRRRLDAPDDWVRHEIAESLRRPGVRVFPLLLDAEMPSAEELPEPLRPLTRRQAFPLTGRHWVKDVAELVEFLKKVPGLAPPLAPEPEAPTAKPAPVSAERSAQATTAAGHRVDRTAQTQKGTRAGMDAPSATAHRLAEGSKPPPEMPVEPAENGGDREKPGAGVPWKVVGAVAAMVAVVLFVWFRPIERTESPAALRPTPSPTPEAPAKVAIKTPEPVPMREPSPTPVKPEVKTQEPAAKPAVALQRGEKFRDCDRCPEMVVISAGEFTMGSPESEEGRSADEGPQHKVRIARPLAAGKYEVTFDEWDACVAAGGCAHKPEDQGWGRGRRPVINVSWDDAQAYVAWLAKKTGKSYRLLSEAEWEYAARAGTTTRYPWGDAPGTNRANFDGSGSQWSGKQTAPVGSFEANAFGLHDVIGNVWEWVQDCWNGSYNGAPADGRAWESGDCGQRVLRGGSWNDQPEDARAANRSRDRPGSRGNDLGFRVARTL